MSARDHFAEERSYLILLSQHPWRMLGFLVGYSPLLAKEEIEAQEVFKK